jgi:hypothetical protein
MGRYSAAIGCGVLCTVAECRPVPNNLVMCPACGRPMLRAVVRDGQYRLMYEVRKWGDRHA